MVVGKINPIRIGFLFPLLSLLSNNKALATMFHHETRRENGDEKVKLNFFFFLSRKTENFMR